MKAKYYLYRNLTNKSFSIKYKGIVIERPTFVVLKNVKFLVSECGRQRVLIEKRKNVHATLACDSFQLNSKIFNIRTFLKKRMTEITYNPYKNDSFIVKNSNKRIKEVEEVICYNNKIYVKKKYFNSDKGSQLSSQNK